MRREPVASAFRGRQWMMNRGISGVLVLAMLMTGFAALLVARPVAAASPDLGWQPSGPVAANSPQNAYLGGIALSPSGTGVITFRRSGAHDFIWATRFVPGAGAGGTNWEVPVQLSQGPWGAYQPTVAMDSAGDAIVVWYEWILSKGYAVYASRYQVGVGWGAPQLIDQPSGYSLTPQIAMNSGGTAFATWQQWDGTRYNIWANRYVAGVGWGVAVALDTTTFTTDSPKVGVDNSGNAFVVWQEHDGTRYNIMSARYSGGAWSAPLALEASPQDATYPAIGMDGPGNAIVSWYQWDGARYNVWANRYAPGPGWTGAITIEASANTVYNYPAPAVAMNSGNGVVAWTMWDGMTYSIYENRYVSGTGWTGEVAVDPFGDYALYPSAAIDDSGNTFVTYQHFPTGSTLTENWAVRYNVAPAGYAHNVLGFADENLGFPAVAVDSTGNALAVWNYDEDFSVDSYRAGILANRYTFGTGWYQPWAAQPAEFDQQLATGGSVLHSNNAGEAVLTWIQDDGPVNDAYASLYYPGYGWGPATQVENLDLGDATEMDSAIDASGNVLALFRIWDGTKFSVYSTHYSVSTGWGAPTRVDALPGDVFWLRVAMDTAGDGMAVWQQYDGTAYSIFASRFDATTSSWSAPTAVEASTNYAYGSDVAMDGSGNAMAVWTQWDGSQYSNFANYYRAGAGWGMPALIETSAVSAGAPAITMNRNGDALVTWSWWTGTNYDAAATSYSPSSGWGTAVTLENTPGDGYTAVPAMDDAGNGMVVWQVWGNAQWDLWAIRHNVVGGWQMPTPLDTAGNDAADVYVALDPAGNGFAVFRQYNGQTWDIVARRYVANQGWNAPAVLTTGTEQTYEPKVAVDGHGDAIAVWGQLHAAAVLPWASEYIVGDGSPNLAVASPVDGTLTNNPAVTVIGTTDPGASVTIDGAVITVAADGSFSRGFALPNGAHTFAVVARNLAGRTTTETRSVTVDTIAPNISIGVPGLLTNVPVIQVTGTTDIGARVVVNGLDVAVGPTGGFSVAIPLREGANTISGTATDAAGNSRTATLPPVILDTVAPSLTISSPAPGVTNIPTVTVAGTAEAGATVTVDGSPVFVGPTGAFSTSVTLPQGTHTFAVVATDAAGNGATASPWITVDTTAPSVAITTPSPGFLTRTPVVSVYGTAEVGARIVVNGILVDNTGGNWFVRIPLAEGLQVIRADARDDAGNAATVSISGTLDMTPPSLSLGSPLDGSITNNPGIFVAGLTDPGTTVTVDGTPVTVSPSGGFSTTVYIVGVHVFDVVATDPAGNVARATAIVEFDNTAPAVAITSPATGRIVSVPTVTITGQTEPGAHVVVNGYSVAVDTTGVFSVRLALQSGANAITAMATDDAGNSATDSITVTYADPVPGLRQQLNNTNDELNNTKDALTQTRNTLATTNANLNATRGDLAVANANLASLGTEALVLLILVIVSIVLGAVQFLMLRRMQGRQQAPPPPT